MEKSKIRQAYNSAFDGIETTSYTNMESAVDYCLRDVQCGLAKDVAAAADPASTTFDTYVGLTLLRIRKYFKSMFDELGLGEFKWVLETIVDVNVHQEHFDFVVDKKTRFSEDVMSAISVGMPFLMLNQRLVIADLNRAWKDHEVKGTSYCANLHLALTIGSTQLAKLVHRVAALYDHTIDEVIPSFVDLILMYAAYFIGSVCLPAFTRAMPGELSNIVYNDVQKMSEIFHRVRYSHLNDLYKNWSEKL